MAEIVRLAKPEAPPRPRPGDFLMTTTATEMLTSLNLIRSSAGGGMTLIAGAPGIGKTETLLHLASELKDGAIYLRVAKGEGRPWGLAYSILRSWGAAPHQDRAFLSGGLTRARERLAASIGPDCIVLVDEAQNLNEYDDKTRLMGAGFEWLRALREEGGFALAFCGDMSLAPIVGDMPQLASRLRRPLTLKGVGKGDVARFAASWGVEDEAAIAALAAVARGRGGLRNVVNVLSTAADFSGGDAPTAESIRAAIHAEGLGPKGGK